MPNPSGPPTDPTRPNKPSQRFTNWLLTGILLALVVLIVSMSGLPPDPDPPGPGTTTEPIANPARIQESAKVGRTYRSVVRAAMDSQVEDRDWGITKVVNIGFLTDFVVTRRIEENDGTRIVEVRTFETVRSTKLLTEADIRINIGEPGIPLLMALDWLVPGSGKVVLTAKQIQPIVEKVASGLATAVVEGETVTALAQVEELEGKAVRITFEDGRGVVNVEDVQGTLTDDERNLIYQTAVLFDYHIMPDLDIGISEEWAVDGQYLGTLLDPTWKGVPSGEITIRRGENRTINGGRVAILQMTDGVLEINSSDKSHHRVGRFQPSGELQFLLDDGYVRRAKVFGELLIEKTSKDHLLFESQFRARPRLQITYSCTME
jgi:hypothetical protein